MSRHHVVSHIPCHAYCGSDVDMLCTSRLVFSIYSRCNYVCNRILMLSVHQVCCAAVSSHMLLPLCHSVSPDGLHKPFKKLINPAAYWAPTSVSRSWPPNKSGSQGESHTYSSIITTASAAVRNNLQGQFHNTGGSRGKGASVSLSLASSSKQEWQ